MLECCVKIMFLDRICISTMQYMGGLKPWGWRQCTQFYFA